MSDLQNTELNEVCFFENGDRGKNYPSRAAYVSEGVPFYSAGNIKNNSINEKSLNFITKDKFDRLNSGKVQKGDIVFCLRGSLGKFAVIENDEAGGIASSLIIIRPTKKINRGYLKMYLQSHLCAEMISKYDNGTAQPNLSGASLKKFMVPLPVITEQERIVKKFNNIEKNIDKALILLRDSLNSSFMVMGSVLDKVYSNGDKKIKDICTISPKKSELRELEEDTVVSFLPMRDLNEHDINFTIKEEKKLIEVYKGYTYFRNGDVLLAKVTPCFENGKAGVAKNLKNGIGFGSSEYHVLRPKEGVVAEWIYYGILAEQFRVTGKESMTGTGGLKRVSSKFVGDWKIPLPDLTTQQREVDRIKEIQIYTRQLQDEIALKLNNLKALKSSLLDQAFKGEL